MWKGIYIGATGRTLRKRNQEHTNGNHNFAIYNQLHATEHKISLDNVKILTQEDR